jgi:DNA-binding NtrC family response regulator
MISQQMTTKKILICDDEEGIRESLKLILGDEYRLILTENGEQCLNCLDNDPDIKLVLLDIKMPQFDGIDILQQIKTDYPDVHVVIVTGYKSVELASEAVKHGASGYIVKPFKSEEILTIARRHLRWSPAAG